MPYISKNDDRREKLRKGEPALNAGELNYQIFYYVKHYCINPVTKIGTRASSIKSFVDQFLGEKPNYQKYNDMTGVLVRCKRELLRRFKRNIDVYNATYVLDNITNSYDDKIAKYEDKKCTDNGDVE